MHKKARKIINYTGLVFILFLMQQLASKLGGFIANLFSYEQIDPQNLFAYISVHHLVILGITLFVIYICKRKYDIDFGFQLGNKTTGIKYLIVFSLIILIYVLVSHFIGYYFEINQPINYPLNIRNVLGTLSFQLFLSGPAEELLFRAIPMSILLFLFNKRRPIIWGVTLETIIAALLFSIAHISWSLNPLLINFDYYQLMYAFVLGLAYGMVYQKSKSIIYPILMHSSSNVIYVGVGYLFKLFI